MDGLGVLIYPYGGKSVVGEWKDGRNGTPNIVIKMENLFGILKWRKMV